MKDSTHIITRPARGQVPKQRGCPVGGNGTVRESQELVCQATTTGPASTRGSWAEGMSPVSLDTLLGPVTQAWSRGQGRHSLTPSVLTSFCSWPPPPKLPPWLWPSTPWCQGPRSFTPTARPQPTGLVCTQLQAPLGFSLLTGGGPEPGPFQGLQEIDCTHHTGCSETPPRFSLCT